MTRDDTGTETYRPKSAAARVARTDRGSLASAEKTETIADRVDVDRIDAELPGEWTVRPDLIRSESETLEETLLFRRSLGDPQLALKPADPSRPRRDIEFHERSGPQTMSRRTMTVDDLTEAVRVAVNRVHQFDR